MNTFSQRILNGSFRGVLRWPQLDALWARVRDGGEWYVYLVGEPPPERAESPASLERFITEIDALLRREHEHDYCGIVYTDDADSPGLVKIYDPHNLGASCGSSGLKILPRWILSRTPPEALETPEILPEGRRRWWRRLFGGEARR